MVSCHFIDYWHSWPCKLNLLVYSWWFHPFWFLFLCWIFHRFGLGCFLHHFSLGILSASLWSGDTFLIAVVWGCFLACFGLGSAFWASLQPIIMTFAVLPWVHWVVALSALLSRVCSLFLLSTRQVSRSAFAQLLALCSGIGFLWHYASSPGFAFMLA